jgi:hypothetical protein
MKWTQEYKEIKTKNNEEGTKMNKIGRYLERQIWANKYDEKCMRKGIKRRTV